MENHNALNYDLFGNVIPSPPSIPEKPVPTPEEQAELDDKEDAFFLSPTKAHAPKYTPVKEGQQHPLGKHGQYKLFHEHVWPKGYSPERLAEVQFAAPVVYGTVSRATHESLKTRPSTNPGSGIENFREDMRITDEFNRHMARSTIPVEQLTAMRDNNIRIVYGVHQTSGLPRGAFSPSERGVYVTPHRETPRESQLIRNIFGTRKTEESRTLMHELGHADDFTTRGMDSFVRTVRFPYGSEDYEASPQGEGYAEGFAKKHNRSTRAMMRRRASNVGYSTNRWLEDPQLERGFVKKLYREARRKAYGGTPDGFDNPQ